ncbi:exodeoxyribonuclease VII large subunit [Oryzifoliimicrobium ureilyticus]|uniref:exodeoxyribonuclease VII large subunit n=1 Tax=Oryzifoliimicrobium ureilyticus TaxID=3113724 RepID=UPI0030764615
MTNLFDSDSLTNLTEYSVSELSGSIKRTMETAFDRVRVRGEISGYRGPHSSGHAYFSLKDDRSRIDAVIWKGTFSRLKFRPEEGMEVIATGKVTTFPGSSKYQIVIETLEPAGAGALMALIEERKRRLGEEGLFDPARKRRLPFMPKLIGVVTSPTGAVIRDILHRIADRFPVHVLLWPVKVQGEGSGQEVANAIAGFNALEPGGVMPRPDVLIVARGGGSLEDLWSFNDEAVVRAAAASAIPLISAVGHETDWTLIDYAADIRAPTPTGAAEMAVPVKAELDAQLAALSARLRGATSRQMDHRRQSLRSLMRAMPSLDQLLALPRRRFDEIAVNLGRGLEMNTLNKRRAFERISARVAPAMDQLLVHPKRRFHEVASHLGRGLELNTLNKRHSFERMAAQLRPDLVSSRLAERRQRLEDRWSRAARSTERMLERLKAPLLRADATFVSLPARLKAQTERLRERINSLTRHADTAVRHQLARGRAELTAQDRMLLSLSYENVLKRGYAIIRDEDEKILGAASAISAGAGLTIQFQDGRIGALATSGDGSTGSRKRPSKPAAAPEQVEPKPKQGTLF